MIAPIKGVKISLTKELTNVPKDAPITTPTAKSTTLPLKINCLNPFNIENNIIINNKYIIPNKKNKSL